MKKLLLLFFSAFAIAAGAQVVNPIHWSWKSEKVKDTEIRLIFEAKIDDKWHTYGMYIGEGGPVKTSFTFDKNADVEFVGKMTETGTKVHEGMDDVFGINVKSFEGSATFTQTIKLKKNTILKGTLEFMACDDKSCLPPDTKDFSFNLNTDLKKKRNDDSVTSVNGASGFCGIDTTPKVAADLTAAMVSGSPCNAGVKGFDVSYFGKPLRDCGKMLEVGSLWDAIIQGFLFGLLALFTPCVFPMIPLTVSLFTKRAETRSKGIGDALTYAGSIVLIYFLLSLPFVLLNASGDTLNDLATGVWYNLFMFALLVIFAFSFLGLYDISLPSFLGTRTDAEADKGGKAGIFFMALTLAIVSFSCTGPLIGTLLGLINGDGGKVKLMVGMTSFGFALALPFAVFALFPALLNRLPRSGGWMDTFKALLGFLELAFAVKFLSNADLVSHWNLIQREIFLGLWALIGIIFFFYCIGGIHFKPDFGERKMSPLKLVMALMAILFTGYSVYGIYGNDTPVFSGFPPPKFYSLNKCKGECPLELPCYHSYCEALEAAKLEHKPLMVDFTGWACVNCRKMEENVWSKKEVYEHIKNDFILVSLYVDDKEALPDSMQYVSAVSGKKIKTVGNKWSDFEISCFKNNSQPYYALISSDEKLLNDPRGYTPDVAEYQKFLECGLGK